MGVTAGSYPVETLVPDAYRELPVYANVSGGQPTMVCVKLASSAQLTLQRFVDDEEYGDPVVVTGPVSFREIIRDFYFPESSGNCFLRYTNTGSTDALLANAEIVWFEE